MERQKARNKDTRELTTSKIASAVKCHPNTVRLYEEWGFLESIPRAENGYRIFSKKHLAQMQLARIALPGPYPGGGDPVYKLVKEAAKYKFNSAMEYACEYKNNVCRETRKAKSVLKDLEKWARFSRCLPDRMLVYSRRRAAALLKITIDTLRTWERNSLVHIQKNSKGHCRYTEKDISRLRIIFALRTAGYSIASIHRMFLEYDSGKIKNISANTLAKILNTPAPDAPIVYVTDIWLTMLEEHRLRVMKIIRMLKNMARVLTDRDD